MISDYDGKLSVIDFYTNEISQYNDATIPMAAAYDGEFIYLIDNYKREILKLKNNKLIKKIRIESKPVNIVFLNDKLYITSNSPNKLYILNSNLDILKSSNLIVDSPAINILNNQIFVPMFDNFEDNKFLTNILFYIPEKNTYIINYANIKFPKDITYYNNNEYIISYFDGKLYKNSYKRQEFVAQFGKYTEKISTYKNYIIGNSLYGGIYFYDTKNGKTTKILEDVPLKDFEISPNNDYIYAISHIYNKLYIIKDFKIFQTLDIDEYPIDIFSPDENIVLVLSTDGETLQIIRRFE
ncbi:hypothetical protein OF820_13390 [Oceanotoga sp. DSM 15011]|uniref:Uncharacterized protein n=1 Tax=Oceanotoga teriensis TaxID=515440 RepID=A0AA45HJS2_9BACT|nr:MULTISPECIES: hypothetical protein [Oceanotoga]MDN5342058.1 hypothetical protein [Oceanotoga sp.]MDO7975472.1 hypothetical protein [Oceanotoga teriensis]PWJ96240.1 hypothetical protein C7380_102157 [Oceanotoga teriensis]UYP00024.1 hypothetical protein OF820_13390 [Oceanotoga sp. DSM 15011]